MPPLTSEQVLALAPDPASAKAGSALATPRKWANLGHDADGRFVWGECQGSGTKPYQTQADLNEPAFKCSCPSRKFPCKHSIGLLLLLAHDSSKFATTAPAPWVAEWAASRQERAEKRAAKKEKEPEDGERVVDPVAKAKRVAARVDKITAGLAELDLWLRDFVRGGIAGAEARPSSFFDGMIARLIDAQAPGAARLVRDLSELPTTGDGWHSRMVARLGRLHLLTSAWSRFDSLSADKQADVRTHLGWSINESELADVPAIDDEWTVIGQVTQEDERLRFRRTWVHGASSGRLALLLNFAHGNAPFSEVLPPVGGSLGGELAFFPGSFQQRAAIRSRRDGESSSVRPTGERKLAAAVGEYAKAIALDPWVERIPLVLDGVVPEQAGKAWRVRDEDGDILPISTRFKGWTLLAVSGARPVWMSAEWTGEYLVPLAVASEDAMVSLSAA